MNGSTGVVKQLVVAWQLQGQLEEAAQGIDVLTHQDWLSLSGGSRRNRPQQAV